MKILSTLVFVCVSVCVSAQSNYLSTGKSAGNWNDPSTWQLAPGSAADDDGDGIPDANDNVTIQSGHTVQVNATNACKNLSIDGQDNLAEIIIAKAASLNVSQKLKISSPLKDSEVYISVKGNLSAGSSKVDSYGAYNSVELKVADGASFAIAATEIKSVAQLTAK